jgi:L-ascorbate metabolism protein UlaG (beta-lactamase superfamily)
MLRRFVCQTRRKSIAKAKAVWYDGDSGVAPVIRAAGDLIVAYLRGGMDMEICWHGHACFTVSHRGYRVVLDPYADGKVDGYPPLRLEAEKVLTSHGHGDHNFVEAVTLSDAGIECPFSITEFQTWHDDEKGAARGANTVTVLEADGLRVVHLGDLGCRLEEAQLKSMIRADAVMIPVGGYYTIGAADANELAERLEARVVIPMHYRGKGFGFSVLAPLEDFTALYPSSMVRYYEDGTVRIDADTPRQVAVLKSPVA